MLTEKQQRLILRRKTLTALWKWVGPACLLLIVGVLGYLFYRTPLLMNPYFLIEQIEGGTLPETTIYVSAVVGSLAFLACGILMLCIIILLFGAVANEKKLLNIIDALQETELPGVKKP